MAGAAVALSGVWLIWRGTGWMTPALGALLLAGGAAAGYVALQRVRFRVAGDGPGIVRVTEGRLAYLGPHHGGAVSLQSLVEIALEPAPEGRLWVLAHSEGPPLVIPVKALGADALFDAFAALPGLDPARLARAVDCPLPSRLVIWSQTVLPKP
ncbi:hypothetical protein DDZ14_11240 [Maritimibacter sp. 55A14]|nr:hypothetical protein DDZ14_11240 [Maritimibacter sp. 55A14]